MSRSYRVDFRVDAFVYPEHSKHSADHLNHHEFGALEMGHAAQRTAGDHDEFRQERHEARHDDRHEDRGHHDGNGHGHHHQDDHWVLGSLRGLDFLSPTFNARMDDLHLMMF